MSRYPDFLPFALPDIDEEEIREVTDSLKSGWLTTGPKVRDFETRFAKFVGAQYALAVNSATAGLHLALDALGIGKGDRVLTTIYTFTATAEVIRYMGADPVFVDVDRHTLNIDSNEVVSALKSDPKIRAIMPVHFAGLPCNMAELVGIANSFDVPIVEDAAHAIPAQSADEMVGSIGDLTVFSFYATKPLATGEGGMVTTDNLAYAERIRTMRLHGINRDVFDRYTTNKPSWFYEVIAPGFKYNMSDIAAALGIPQLRKAWAFQARRQEIAQRYTNSFRGLPLQLPAEGEPGDVHAWHLYVIRLELERLSISRDEFIERMIKLGVGVSVHYIPLHLQPYWRDKYGLKPDQYPVAQRTFECVVSLPIYTSMTDSDVQRVIDAVHETLVER